MIKIRFYLITIVILSQLISCSGQKIKKEKILGNWQVVNNDSNNIIYQEIFINDSNIYYYEINVGMRPKAEYYIENNILFHSQLGSKFDEIGELKIEGDTLTISGYNHQVSWRIINGPNVLERFVNNRVTKAEFWEAYLSRYEEWLNN